MCFVTELFGVWRARGKNKNILAIWDHKVTCIREAWFKCVRCCAGPPGLNFLFCFLSFFPSPPSQIEKKSTFALSRLLLSLSLSLSVCLPLSLSLFVCQAWRKCRLGNERTYARQRRIRAVRKNLSGRTRAAALLEVKTNSLDHCTVVNDRDFTSINWCSALTGAPMVFAHSSCGCDNICKYTDGLKSR